LPRARIKGTRRPQGQQSLRSNSGSSAMLAANAPRLVERVRAGARLPHRGRRSSLLEARIPRGLTAPERLAPLDSAGLFLAEPRAAILTKA
jgi:hypothetical protein